MLKVFYSSFIGLLLPGMCWGQGSPIDAAARAAQSMVQVRTVYVKELRAGPESGGTPRMVSYERNGSGIVIDAAGIIVTNTHIILNAPHIFVVLPDGTKLAAKVAFVSPVYDFSLLSVTPPFPLTPARWADSSRIALGQEIMGIGNSDFDNGGILAGEVTRILQSRSEGTNEFFVVNLNLYKGDSGGPILDRQGRLLGIVMAKERTDDRVAVAIACDKIREQYLRYKRGDYR